MSYLEKKENSSIFLIQKTLHSNQFGHTVNAVAATSYLAMLWELNVRNVHYPRSLGFGGSYVHGRDDILSFGWCRGKSSLKNMRNIGGCHHQHHLSTQGRRIVSNIGGAYI